MKDSKIEWTDHTFNPWSGCTKVSPGCAHCYAESLAKRAPKTLGGWGAGVPRRRTSEDYWRGPVKWNREAARDQWELDTTGKVTDESGETIAWHRPRVFCASLADWLDDEVPVEWLADLLALIHKTPHLDWLLLTKRPQNWRERMLAVTRHDLAGGGIAIGDAFEIAAGRNDKPVAQMAGRWVRGEAPVNVWIGTTVEDQTRADQRIPHLIRIPARVRFLSCEPMVGPVYLGGALYSDYDKAAHEPQLLTPLGGFNSAKVNWVICGGESGPGARPMHPEWARSLRDECKEAGTHFFFKQWGEWCPGVARLKPYYHAKPEEYVNEVRWVSTGKTVGITERTQQRNLTTPEREPHRFEDGEILTYRIGKEEAGRLLDGREWSEIPKGATP